MIASRFELVSFDCDGVLVDSEPIINQARARVLTRLRLFHQRTGSRRAFLRHERSGNAQNHRARVASCAADVLRRACRKDDRELVSSIACSIEEVAEALDRREEFQKVHGGAALAGRGDECEQADLRRSHLQHASVHDMGPCCEVRNRGARRAPWRVGLASLISPTFFRPQCKRTFCEAELLGSV